MISAHLVEALLRNKEYDKGRTECGCSRIALTAIQEQIAKKPESVLTYQYLLSACEGHADPRVLNYIYAEGVKRIPDNAMLFMQYAEFLEEMNEFELSKEMFRRAYEITPTDDLARSVIRVSPPFSVSCRCRSSAETTTKRARYWTF